GITTTQRSGEPGRDAADIYIRGIATFAAGNATPLILVDGIPRNNISTIDPYTIESLNILKDASATAVFGVRGANGVIIITTKTGTSGKPQFSFSSNYALQNPIRLPKPLNSLDFATLRNEAAFNDAVAAGNPNPQNAFVFSDYDLERYKNGDDPFFHPDINWFDYMLKDFAPQQQYNLNISGGVNNAKYFVSLGYLNQQGAYSVGDFFDEFSSNPKYDRYNVRTNFDFNLSPKLSLSIKVGADLSSSNYSRSSTSDIFGTILSASPMMSPVIFDDKIIRFTAGTAGAFQISNTPLLQMLGQGFNTNFGSDLNTNVAAKYDLGDVTKGLSVRGQVAYDNFYSQSANRTKSIPLWDLVYDPNAQNFLDSIKPIATINQFEGPVVFAGESFRNTSKVYGEAAIDYKRSFGNHNVTGLILGTAERFYNGEDELPFNYLGLVARLTYNYKGKYLGDFSMGYNGSENFIKGKQFGFFPAGSIGYVITEEKFIPKNNVLTFLKLRASYGQVGNDKLGNNRFLFTPDAFRVGNQYWFGLNQNRQTGYTEARLGNSDVTWEVATKMNLAVDFRFFKEKISLTTEYFTESREQILWNLNIPITFGSQGLLAPYNIGQASNRGIEFELGYRDKIPGTDFGFSINTNYSFVRNKIIYQDEIPQPFPGLAATGNRIGQPKGLV
ncbi:SusC/RagA family TonB-linked outer membrane protein, partial [Anabaena sp. AL93]|uniref:SusC/RagA family TonB-linked outer membrane protein n=1 Tax=Anabaena sp. AL93 TaxID=1678133 RepID=UPI0007FF3E8E